MRGSIGSWVSLPVYGSLATYPWVITLDRAIDERSSGDDTTSMDHDDRDYQDGDLDDGVVAEACACDEGEVCTLCAPEGLPLRLQLQLSLIWARQPQELRERGDAHEYLAVISQNN
jgi:hypothetical protein